MLTGVLHTSKVYEKFLKLLNDQQIQIIQSANTDLIEFNNSNILDIIYPKSDYWGQKADNLNNNSIVVRFTDDNGHRFLFTGDIEAETEQSILDNTDFNKLKSDILKVAHHGADTSSSQEFLEAVSPSEAVISVGEGNSHGHPSLKTIRKLEDMGVKVMRTDEMGDIIFR